MHFTRKLLARDVTMLASLGNLQLAMCYPAHHVVAGCAA
jgi:hypothetical protein